MRNIRIIFLVSMVFLLTGCSFEYNINIDKDIISENNVVYIENTTSDNIRDTFQNMVSKYTGPTDSLGMYESSIIKGKYNSGISYKEEYSFSDYNYSISFSACYDAYKLINDDGKLIISTSEVFKCFDIYEELDSVVVNLTTNYGVEKSNADNVSKNKYTWYINKDNFDEKPINIIIDLGDYHQKKGKFNFNVFMLALSSLIIIGLIVLLVMKRNKKVNKI